MPRMSRARAAVGPLLAAALVTIGALLVAALLDGERNPDSAWYRRMIAGRWEEIRLPFAGRVLHALTTGALVRATGLFDLTVARGVAIVGLFALAAGTAVLWRRTGLPLLFVGIALATPLSVNLLAQPLLPDLFFAALFVWFCVALPRSRPAALAILVALAVTRETALFLTLALAVAAIDRRRFGTAATLVGVAFAAWIAVAMEFASRGSGNVHAMVGPLYLASKFVFNLVRNVFGLELWIDTLSYCEPQVTWRLPDFLPTGAVKSIGWCGFDERRPLAMLAGWLTLFGILPSIALGRLGSPFRRRVTPDEPWELAGIRLGGWAFFAAAPTLGSTLGRLIAMGWPAFWIATPALLARAGGPAPARRTLGAALLLHGAVAWLPVFATALIANRTLALSVVVAGALPAHVWAWRKARDLRRMGSSAEGNVRREAERSGSPPAAPRA